MIGLYDLIEAAKGQLFGEPAAQIFTDFCLNVQDARESLLFVARRTDAGDTHQHIEEAIQRGVSGILCTDPPECSTDGVTIVMSRDPDNAMLLWSRAMLAKLGTKVIGVAGSTGKSITVEAISRVLSTRYNVLSRNTDRDDPLNVPLSLARLTSEHDFAVLKLGVNYPGEMAPMVETIQPDMGVVTHIDYAYAPSFKDRDHLAREMSLLVEYLSPSNTAILNYDDDYVREMMTRVRATIRTAGLDSFGADLMGYNIVLGPTGTGFDLRYSGERYVGRWTPLLGKQSLYAVLVGLLAGIHYGVTLEAGLKVLTDIQALPGRMNPLIGLNNCLMVDDSYSANPGSTLAALDWLDEARVEGQRSIFVMGDMDNLGSYSQYNHRLIGNRAAEVANVVITQGTEAALVGRSALDQGMNPQSVFTTYSTQDAIAALHSLDLDEHDLILIKGGHSARMEFITLATLADEQDRERIVRKEQLIDISELFQSLRPSRVEIDTDALANNIRIIKEYIGDDVSLMAVVKANAYGHGAVMCAQTALSNGAEYLAVASLAEALELRDAGIDSPILVLSYTPISAVRQAIQQNITISLYDHQVAHAYNRAARDAQGTLKVHVKVDTGLGRLGIFYADALLLFRQLSNLKNLEAEGLYTHFSSADDNPEYTSEQVENFRNIIRPMRAAGFQFSYVHAANSAGILGNTDNHFNMVRAGILMYGLRPSASLPMLEGIQPVMSWKTIVAQVRTLPPDYPVGYGNSYYTSHEEKIAILPVGYADGLRRAPQPWKEVLIHGQRAPIVGRISMEKCAVNVSHISGVSVGDEVVLLGAQGGDVITADEVAEWLGTINYEVVTTILPHLPRR